MNQKSILPALVGGMRRKFRLEPPVSDEELRPGLERLSDPGVLAEFKEDQ